MIAAVVVIAVAAGAVMLMNNGSNDNPNTPVTPDDPVIPPKEKSDVEKAREAAAAEAEKNYSKGGLYRLKAVIAPTDMASVSGSVQLIDVIEDWYAKVYGDLYEGADKLTLADAKKDTAFWNKYCDYERMAWTNSDGTISYKTEYITGSKELNTYTIPAKGADVGILIGGSYASIAYYMDCFEHNVKPYSAEANKITEITTKLQRLLYSGLVMSSVTNSYPELAKMYPENYLERCTSLAKYDKEALAEDLKNAAAIPDSVVILMASNGMSADLTFTVETASLYGAYCYFNNAHTIPESLQVIDTEGRIFGYGTTVDKVIEDMQLRMYKVWWSVQKLGNPVHKAYFESNKGKALSATSTGTYICEFFGWDISLMDGKEHSTEDLLEQKPDVLIFYTNDSRTQDEEMRATAV